MLQFASIYNITQSIVMIICYTWFCVENNNKRKKTPKDKILHVF